MAVRARFGFAGFPPRTAAVLTVAERSSARPSSAGAASSAARCRVEGVCALARKEKGTGPLGRRVSCSSSNMSPRSATRGDVGMRSESGAYSVSPEITEAARALRLERGERERPREAAMARRAGERLRGRRWRRLTGLE
jgi:hypothetical protein